MDSAIPAPANAMMCVLGIQQKCFVLQHGTEGRLCVNIQEAARQTALMSSSALAECLVSESARQS